MQVIRHPELASDIREVSLHYAEISERLLSAFWAELDAVLASIERNPGVTITIRAGFAELT